MWLRGDFLVPYLNGHTYSHKPPLLFWLIQAGWGVFGVNDWWPRLVGPLAALVNLLLVRRLAAMLWPGQADVAGLARGYWPVPCFGLCLLRRPCSTSC
ncbi:ArnT family glycosyltransferase [Methylomonas koyamae]|uniref:ArnT family glycosyltransferase n=1 Tax=Methylomonas koyamae TaxID=702114 RepID=UPI000AACD2FD|nr:hypothetical protein [Methylomonas koyamae]